MKTTTEPFILSVWGRLHEPKENYAGSGTWINFLHSLLSSKMPSLRPLASISCASPPSMFFWSPLRSFNLPSVDKFYSPDWRICMFTSHMAKHHKRFSLIFSSIGATPILVRISFLTLSLLVLPHIQRSMRISAILIFWAWYLYSLIFRAI